MPDEAAGVAEGWQPFIVDKGHNLFVLDLVDEGDPSTESSINGEMNSGPDDLITNISTSIVINTNKFSNFFSQFLSKLFG
jgi:hypothetical protein